MKRAFSIIGIGAVLAALGYFGASPLHAQSAEELAKKVTNPVAALISVPLQQNFNVNFKPYGGFQYLNNIQPVIPVQLNRKWNMISRTVIPFIAQNNVIEPGSTQTGFGDIVQSLFFSPIKASKVIWGVGPAFLLPTATSASIGTKKWAVGPTGVILVMTGPWTVGILGNHVWSFAGSADRQDLSMSYFQPFVSRVYKGGFSWSISSEDTFSWRGENTFSGSLALALGQVISVQGQMISVGIGPRILFGDVPVRGRWGFRLTTSFLFPTKK